MARFSLLLSALCVASTSANKSFATPNTWGVVQNIPRGGGSYDDVKSDAVEKATQKVGLNKNISYLLDI